jgi:predicted peptidase
MKIRALLAFCCAMIVAATAAEEDMAIKNQQPKSFQSHISKDMQLEYLLFLPSGYKEGGAKPWPLMLFLHGAGERGTNLSKVTAHGPPKLVKTQPDFPFIVISPQCPNNQTWSDKSDALLALLDDVIKNYRVDEKHVYLTGLSMGGFGTWDLGIKHPNRFAAIVPICGGGDILPILLAPARNEKALKSLPVWVFHGGKDPIVPVAESEHMIHALKQIGNQQVKFTVYPEAGHDSWTEAYNTAELYDWMLEQSRGKKPKSK